MAQGDLALDAWLVIGGPLTALPLLLFAAGARRLPLATVGPAAVPVADPPAGAGRVGLPRALRPRAAARLRLHLGRRCCCTRWTAGAAGAPRRRLTASGRRRADQVVEGRQRRLGAVAGGDDDLLEGHRRRIARGEHAGQAGGAARRRRRSRRSGSARPCPSATRCWAPGRSARTRRPARSCCSSPLTRSLKRRPLTFWPSPVISSVCAFGVHRDVGQALQLASPAPRRPSAGRRTRSA